MPGWLIGIGLPIATIGLVVGVLSLFLLSISGIGVYQLKKARIRAGSLILLVGGLLSVALNPGVAVGPAIMLGVAIAGLLPRTG